MRAASGPDSVQVCKKSILRSTTPKRQAFTGASVRFWTGVNRSGGEIPRSHSSFDYRGVYKHDGQECFLRAGSTLDKKLRAVSGRIVLNLSAFKASAILGFRIFQIAIPSKIQTQSCVRTGVPL